MAASVSTTAHSPYLNKPLRSLEQAAQDVDHRRHVEGPVERLDKSDAAAEGEHATNDNTAGTVPTPAHLRHRTLSIAV